LSLPFVRFEGLVYRAHHPAWAFDPESGEGARIYGGRFNRAGTACFYAALSLNTVWLEAQQGFAFKAQPLTICSYRAQLDHILDLTDREARELAAHLIAAGCVGIIVPSFASRSQTDDRNLVLWQWSREPPNQLAVIDDDARLPRDQKSWEPAL
jgi:RES domain-containing protein